jgi:hypothetical protein
MPDIAEISEREDDDEVRGLAATWVARTRHLRGDDLPVAPRNEPRTGAVDRD